MGLLSRLVHKGPFLQNLTLEGFDVPVPLKFNRVHSVGRGDEGVH